jgi:hypothetical protein
VPRSIISFGFKDSFISDGFSKGLEARTAFRRLTKITSHIETFFLAGTKAEAGAGGTETEAWVTIATEIFRTVGVFGIAETAGAKAETGITIAIEIVRIVETVKRGAGAETETEAGIALGIEAFSYAQLNKNSI